MTTPKIPPQSEWHTLTVSQLYDLKSNLTDVYYNACRSGATYANQYLGFLHSADMAIAHAELKAQQEKAEREQQKAQVLAEHST